MNGDEKCDVCHREALIAMSLCSSCADERDQLRARLAEVERERDDARAVPCGVCRCCEYGLDCRNSSPNAERHLRPVAYKWLVTEPAIRIEHVPNAVDSLLHLLDAVRDEAIDACARKLEVQAGKAFRDGHRKAAAGDLTALADGTAVANAMNAMADDIRRMKERSDG